MAGNLIDVAYESLEFLIAIGVLGEVARDLIPRGWFPEFVTDAHINRVAWWSTLTLVISLFLVVPVSLVRDSQLSQVINRSNISFHILTNNQLTTLKEKLKSLTAGQFSILMYEIYRDPNSEQAIFSHQLADALTSAGWTKSQNPFLTRMWNPTYIKGIKIGYAAQDKKSREMAEAVYHILDDDLDASSTLVPFTDVPAKTLAFEVGYP